MKNILKIQELEREIRKLSASSGSSRESAEYEQIKENRRIIRDNITSLEQAAGTIAKQLEQITNRYEQLQAKAEITNKQKPEIADVNNISTIVEDANYLTSELAKIEQKMRELNDRSTKLVNEFNIAMTNQYNMRTRQSQLKQILDQKQANVLPLIEEKQAQIKKLEADVDKSMYEKYRNLVKDNIFPVFVHLKDNRCSACRMEQSLHFIQKLKQTGMLSCEECRRIILADD